MNYPKLKFRLNRKLDFEMAKEFLNQKKVGGISFGEYGILKPHPDMRKINLKSDQDIKKYIDNFYKENIKILEKELKIFQVRWQTVAKDFFSLCDQLFDHLAWPKGKYIAYISIFSCGPRFLDDKTFQVFYEPKYEKETNFCIIHEMLHFQFYNYLDKRLKQHKSKDANKIWELSEIFDSLVMWQDENWRKICAPVRFFYNYPAFKKKIDKLKPIWDKNKSIELLFDNYLK
jgi:hypothetical protein